MEVLQRDWADGQDAEAVAAAAAAIDLDADEATCPACQGTIPAGSERCPECGLRIA
ncbi:MAG: hypothetical protein QF903_15630 [Planctomycetota bacterium]|nr:hypothetical protein [Planctomycetota bacterium]MDP6763102.1 hypothetical protein [Planctomycetota bacterium]MDP6990900.1 hypothetical protein [Planctomycetota bacterium]